MSRRLTLPFIKRSATAVIIQLAALISFTAPLPAQDAYLPPATLKKLTVEKLVAQTAVSPQSQVEAVFLYNFARFVTWPQKAFPDPQAPLVIGVLGEDPFGAYLDETVRGEKVNGRPLVVQRYRRLGEIKACHVLFISKSEGDRLEQILAALRGRNILTVSDADGFTTRGGMIRFFTEKNKVRIQVDLDVVKSANLNVSSKLLRVAEIQH